MAKKALITGITGQDASYLAELLIEKGYEVHGIVRQASTNNRERIARVSPQGLMLHFGDMTDKESLEKIVAQTKPDEVYHLAAQSHVHVSFEIPGYTTNVIANGTLRLLEAIKNHAPHARVYNASTSEMFGNSLRFPQSESTPLNPESPYARAKVFAHEKAKQFRQADGMFIANGILFNHESERRGHEYVTRKITNALARIKHGLQGRLVLGNIDTKRDWGYSPDYVQVMWTMLQQDKPDDFVVGTGETHSVREFLEESAKRIGLDIESNGKKDAEEKFFDTDGKVIVTISPKFFRPSEVYVLIADPTKAYTQLSWEPKIKFNELVYRMCEHDMALAHKEVLTKNL